MDNENDEKKKPEADKAEPEKDQAKKPEADKVADDQQQDDDGSADDDAKERERKAKAAEDRRVQARAEKLAEKLAAEKLAEKEREAAEAAEAAKKPEIDRLSAEKKKLEDKLAELQREAAAAKLAASLADEMTDADLRPASPNARKHIAAAFKAAVEAGKDPAEAIKAVAEEEPYLFAKPLAADQAKGGDKKVVNPGKTAPAEKGATVVERSAGSSGSSGKPESKKPGELTDPAEIAKAIRERHGLTVHLGGYSAAVK